MGRLYASLGTEGKWRRGGKHADTWDVARALNRLLHGQGVGLRLSFKPGDDQIAGRLRGYAQMGRSRNGVFLEP